MNLRHYHTGKNSILLHRRWGLLSLVKSLRFLIPSRIRIVINGLRKLLRRCIGGLNDGGILIYLRWTMMWGISLVFQGVVNGKVWRHGESLACEKILKV